MPTAIPKAVLPILQKYAQLIMDMLKKNVEGHQASFKLYQSIQVNIAVYPNLYTMEISMEKYWQFLEYGRKPGKYPPPDFITKWTVQKGFSMEKVYAQFRGGKNTRNKKPINRESVRRQLSFLIGRKIAKKGIQPTYFASKVLGKPFVERGELTGQLWDKMRGDLTEAVGHEIIIQVTNFNKP